MKRWVAMAAVAFVVTACGQMSSTSSKTQPRHVFLIVMENHSANQAMSGAFTASLAAKYRVAGNYRALTSGKTWGVSDDSYYPLPAEDLGTQLTKAGVSWRAYMEGMDSRGCLDSPPPYDPGHNPFAYYGGRCPPNVVPLTQLSTDLAGKTPQFTWISPDMCHDT